MTLLNGPFNNTEIADLGTVTQKLSLHRPLPSGLIECGLAVYEPDPSRSRSFWSHNEWDGSTLVTLGDLHSPDTNSPD